MHVSVCLSTAITAVCSLLVVPLVNMDKLKYLSKRPWFEECWILNPFRFFMCMKEQQQEFNTLANQYIFELRYKMANTSISSIVYYSETTKDWWFNTFPNVPFWIRRCSWKSYSISGGQYSTCLSWAEQTLDCWHYQFNQFTHTFWFCWI